MRVLWLFFAAVSLYCREEIVFWHSFEGFLADQFVKIVDDFNDQSEVFYVKLVYRGNYTETFNAGVKAFAEGKAPHILQVYEVATQTMMQKPEMFLSIDQFLSHIRYIDAAREFYSDSEGRMHSLPWNVSTGVLFYNKEAFKKAGLDPDRPPETWEEMEAFGQKLTAVGILGFTTAWPVAYHLEHLCSWHNLPFASGGNGFEGLHARLIFNGPFQIRHLEKLVEWQKGGIFSYQGRFTTEPEKLFTSGMCAMLLQGANRFPVLKTTFPVGAGLMPYWSDLEGAPYRLNIGGSSFWVISGFDEKVYRGIAHFLAYLSSPEIQSYWHQKTGYLPITEAAYHLVPRGFYQKNPAAEMAILEVMNSHNTPFTKGIRLGNYVMVREKILDFLEKAFSGELSPKEALDGAVKEGNELLADFEKSQ